MYRAAFQLFVVACASLTACGGKRAASPQPKPVPTEAEDYCASNRVVGRTDYFGDFCRAGGSDPELEKRMTDILVGGGADLRRYDLRCREWICSVKCIAAPREQCVYELHSVGRWSASKQIFDSMGFQDKRGQAVFRFESPARRELQARIATRLHDSPAFKACQQSANAHGVLHLFVDVPRSGTPSVRVYGDLADTTDADCVSKALLATIIDEHVAPPAPSGELSVAVKL